MRRFLTPRWLALHAVMIVLVTAFLALGWWQVTRARAGNTISVAYAAEWPVFALFVFGIWVREVRAELRSSGKPSEPAEPTQPQPQRRRPVVVPVTPVGGASGAANHDADDDPALAAYNEYLAWLAANPDRRPSEYRPASNPASHAANRQGE
ncbi:MAG: hypothetical protein FWJ93_08160 [Micromonosporaceae bacterium]